MKPITQIPPSTPQRPGGIPTPIGTSRPPLSTSINNNNNGYSNNTMTPTVGNSMSMNNNNTQIPLANNNPNNNNMMPVYDMTTGKLLGLFPLAPG